MPLKTDGSSFLTTPSPYHTPGYGGYCPQFKYRIGQTFGKTTADLLRSCDVASSGNLVLAKNELVTTLTPEQQIEAQALATRTQSLGDQKLKEVMVPGYTGFIPRSQKHYGRRYSDICRSSIAEFEVDHRRHVQKIGELQKLTASANAAPTSARNLPEPAIKTCYLPRLNAIMPEAEPYPEKNFFEPESPYFMQPGNPKKKFMSGYTGFVPRARAVFGKGYPPATHTALNDFTQSSGELTFAEQQPIVINRPERCTVDGKPLYPRSSGLVPHFTGHIPGQKFRHGQTFGEATVNAKRNMPTPRNQVAVCQ